MRKHYIMYCRATHVSVQELILVVHYGHTSKGCGTMIIPIKLGDMDITQDLVRVISILPRSCFRHKKFKLEQHSSQQKRKEWYIDH